MESKQKKVLKALSLKLRHLLEGHYDADGDWHEGDLEKRLNRLGVWRERDPVPVSELSGLSEADERARRAIDAYLKLRRESDASTSQAVAEFVQETAYTWANRLLALRCMEARDLIDRVILQQEEYGGRSLQHHRLAQRHPELCSGEDDGLFHVLEEEFNRQADHLPHLFDPEAPGVALRPSPAVLKTCIALLSGTEPVNGECASEETFSAQDALGWAYQYWNTEEKDRVMGQSGKIEGKDIIPVTQLYTEPYMVQFLVQNSLGATWMEMHPESSLHEKWEYYVEDADRAPTEKKPVNEITFLDDACGSGHFLQEAFDLFYDMYREEEEITDPEEVCRSILENNLYGIDIDERAVQIAEVTLWMKAAEKSFDFRGTPQNLVATNIHLPQADDHLERFLQEHPEDRGLRPALEKIFDSLEHVDELGSLVRIEEPVEEELAHLRKVCRESQTGDRQQEMFGPTEVQSELPLDVESYEEWKQRVLNRLRKHFETEAENADRAKAFFNRRATEGIALFDALSRKYHVVAFNPPYLSRGRFPKRLKTFLSQRYPQGKKDTFAAFIMRGLELAHNSGYVSTVSRDAWLMLGAYTSLRHWIINNHKVNIAVSLGPQAFHAPLHDGVSVAFSILQNEDPGPEDEMQCFDFAQKTSPEEKATLLRRGVYDLDKVAMRQKDVADVPDCKFLLGVSENLIKIVTKNKKFRDSCAVKQGLATADNKRFVRMNCECAGEDSGWVRYAKGGGYGRWAGQDYYVVDWRHGGKRIELNGRGRIQNTDYYFLQGFTYAMAGRSLAVRVFRNGGIFGHAGPGVFPPNSWGYYGALLNSTFASYVIRRYTSKPDIEVGHLKSLPLPEDNSLEKNIDALAKKVIAKKKQLVERQAPPHFFYDPDNDIWSTECLNEELYLSACVCAIEGEIEHKIVQEYKLHTDDIRRIAEDVGTPVGWLPLIKGYARPLCEFNRPYESTDSNSANRSQAQVLDISGQTLNVIKSTLKQLFEGGPGTQPPDDYSFAVFNNDPRVPSAARKPIPAESFLEELSRKLKVNPVSAYHLLREGIEQEGWRCIPEEQRLMKDRVTIVILESLGHRWPKQIQKRGPVPNGADEDGVIPLTIGSQERKLLDRVRKRVTEEMGYEHTRSVEEAFEEIMDESLDYWLKKKFFKHHTSQFQKRPIAWQLQSNTFTKRRSPAFACMIYYHALDADLLPKIRTQYIQPVRDRYRTELRGIESQSAENRTDQQESRRAELQGLIEELDDMDEALKNVQRHGFGPPQVQEDLRQAAIEGATLCLKAQWLDRLSEHVQKGPLENWCEMADETDLESPVGDWIEDSLSRLDHQCAEAGIEVPNHDDLPDEPTSTDLAALICENPNRMVRDALEAACEQWYDRVDEEEFQSLRDVRRESRKEAKEIKARLKSDESIPDEQLRTLERKRKDLMAKAREADKKYKDLREQAEDLREEIESWRCEEASNWEDWLADQPMFDEISSVDGRREPPGTVKDFIRQESAYIPDINDGVRVNIAPIQKAGLLPKDVLSKSDMNSAIADRIEWRSDERRWAREGKLPQPGWWPKED